MLFVKFDSTTKTFKVFARYVPPLLAEEQEANPVKIVKSLLKNKIEKKAKNKNKTNPDNRRISELPTGYQTWVYYFEAQICVIYKRNESRHVTAKQFKTQ